MSDPSQVGPRRGVVAVICRDQHLLVIRRSQQVEAPGAYCFPGGAIEQGETPSEALRRELAEELGVQVRPLRELWTSLTTWNVALSWWLAELDASMTIRPNANEVDAVLWLTPARMRQLPALLESNLAFLDAWQRGAFHLGEDSSNLS